MPEDSFESPLTLAACGGHTQMVQLLLAHGASTEEANDENYTPLMEAAREGHLDVVQILLRAGQFPLTKGFCRMIIQTKLKCK